MGDGNALVFHIVKSKNCLSFSQKLVAKCKGMKSLKLNFCHNLSKISLKAIGKGLKGLLTLSMAHCPNLTEQV